MKGGALTALHTAVANLAILPLIQRQPHGTLQVLLNLHQSPHTAVLLPIIKHTKVLAVKCRLQQAAYRLHTVGTQSLLQACASAGCSKQHTAAFGKHAVCTTACAKGSQQCKCFSLPEYMLRPFAASKLQ